VSVWEIWALATQVPGGRDARAAPGVQGWQRQRYIQGQMVPHAPPWDEMARERRRHQKSPTHPHISTSFLLFFCG